MGTIINSWHDDEIAALRRMWDEGVSASKISRALPGPGRTRSAVCATARRLGLPRRDNPEHRAAHPRAAPATRPKKTPIPTLPAPSSSDWVSFGQNHYLPNKDILLLPPPSAYTPLEIILNTPPVGAPVGVLDLCPGDCRWPLGDPGEAGFGFCAGPAITGHPYCAEHCAIAYVPARRRGGKPFYRQGAGR